jgi:hypothetical protein
MKNSPTSPSWFAALAASAAVALAGCATNYAPRPLDAPEELREFHTKTVGEVTVAVSIMTDEEARTHFGADFGEHDLQALWMSVRNASDRRLWFIRNMLDPDFYSAEEAALMLQGGIPRDDRERLRQHLRDEEVRALLLPGHVTQGFVYLPRHEGGRYVDIRLQSDAYREEAAGQERGSRPRELRFDFAVPLPDGDFDYERLDSEKTYPGQLLLELTVEEFRAELERLPCCAKDADGEHDGDPLNIVLVGEASDVLDGLSRSGWSFTHRIDLRTIRREIGAAVSGDAYPVAPVSSLYLFGRKQDIALQRARTSIAQRNHMRLWLAPFRFDGCSVWVGQISRDIGIKVTPKSPTLTTHIIDPEVDTTREYLLHSLIAAGLIDRFGFVKGSAAATAEAPRYNLTGDPYISDGMRLVVILPTEPVPADRIRSLMWEESAPPIAEGQSEAARRNVRPIDPSAPAPPP